MKKQGKGGCYLALVVLFSMPLCSVMVYFFVIALRTRAIMIGASPFLLFSLALYSYGLAVLTLPILLARIVDLTRQGVMESSLSTKSIVAYGVLILTLPPIIFFMI